MTGTNTSASVETDEVKAGPYRPLNDGPWSEPQRAKRKAEYRAKSDAARNEGSDAWENDCG